MTRRIEFSRFGGPEVLDLVQREAPLAGPGEVRIAVVAAGLNPLDYKIFGGLPTSQPHVFDLPSGNGMDFAGTIDQVGEGITALTVGDEVMGSTIRGAQADFVVVDATSLIAKPLGLEWVLAAGLTTVARTAVASLDAIEAGPEDTVLVSAAAGGVGILACQLAKRRGARVIGTASLENHEYLRSLGIEPVEYGESLVDAVLAIAPDGITAALDNHGRASVDAALALGAPASRINSIADYGAAEKYGTLSAGASSASADDVAMVAMLVAVGEVQLPIDSTYPLEEARAAYERLKDRHVRGKIVLTL
jgi:NADPH:quinone reductase-like Zn-dependent oxidoreductase